MWNGSENKEGKEMWNGSTNKSTNKEVKKMRRLFVVSFVVVSLVVAVFVFKSQQKVMLEPQVSGEVESTISTATDPAGGKAETEVTLNVIQPLPQMPPPPPQMPPQIFVEVEPKTRIVGKGDPVTLKWKVTDAASVHISGIAGIGNVPISGTKVVFPTETTKHVFTATGAGGKAETVVEVQVLQVPVYKGKIVESDTPKLFVYKDDKSREWYFVVFEVTGEAKIRAPFDGEFSFIEVWDISGGFGQKDRSYPAVAVRVLDHNRATLASIVVFGDGLTLATDLKDIQRGERINVKKGMVIAVGRGKFYLQFARSHFINNEWKGKNDYNMLYYYFPSLFDGK